MGDFPQLSLTIEIGLEITRRWLIKGLSWGYPILKRGPRMSGIEWIRAKCVGQALGSLTAPGTHQPFGPEIQVAVTAHK